MQHTITLKPRPLALAVAVALGATPASSFAAAGRIQFAWGQVSVEQEGGGSAPLKRGDSVDAGDTIVTERGRAQIKFTDGSKISLQPETSFKINEYNYEAGGSANEERSFMSLFRGGLRAISGAIGRSNRDSYRLTTPVGTIGIRGTEYLIMLDGSGMVVTVGDGAIAMVNDAGEVILLNGQTGRIVDKNSLPKIVDTKAVVPPPPKDSKDDPNTGEPQQDDDEFQISVSEDDGDRDDALGNVVILPDGEEPPGETTQPPPVIVEPKLESGAGYTVAFSFPAPGGPTNITSEDHNLDATFVDGQLTAFTDGDTSSSIGDLVLIEAGSDQFIGWGRWSNPSNATANFTVQDSPESFDQQNESLHYVAGRPTDLAALASAGQTGANYSILSFTSPTDNTGAVGTLDQANTRIAVDFGSAVVDLSVALTISGNDYAIFVPGLGATGGKFQDSGLFVDSSSSCFSGGCSGDISGLIAGPNADRAGFVYGIDDFDTFKTTSGAVTFFRDPAGPAPSFPE